MEHNREYIPFSHNGKIIMVPVLEMDEVKHLAPTTVEHRRITHETWKA